MSEKNPKYLYKYVPVDLYSLENLINYQIYFSSPKNFNDPFDCNINVKIKDLSDKEIKALLENFKNSDLRPSIQKAIPDLKGDWYECYKSFDLEKQKEIILNFINAPIESANSIKKNILETKGVYCLSEKYFDILMWSQYSDSHKGFCVEFDTTKDETFQKTRKVIYSDEIPLFKVPIEESIKDVVNENFNKIVSTKFSCWSYEKEWRVLHLEKDKTYGLKRGSITSIYFGLNIKSEHKDIIYLIMNSHQTEIRYYQMEKDPDSYKLNAVEIPVPTNT